jgi:hypothetical protein
VPVNRLSTLATGYFIDDVLRCQRVSARRTVWNDETSVEKVSHNVWLERVSPGELGGGLPWSPGCHLTERSRFAVEAVR